jgi:hypothetical protein
VEVRSVQDDGVYVHRVKLKKMNEKKQRGKGALYTFSIDVTIHNTPIALSFVSSQSVP